MQVSTEEQSFISEVMGQCWKPAGQILGHMAGDDPVSTIINVGKEFCNCNHIRRGFLFSVKRSGSL